MSLGAIRFLIVDDMEVMRKLTVDQLRTLGAQHIEQAVDGQAALHLLRTRPFDLVLSDWNMPVMSGIALLQAVRADPDLRTLPLIMVTAESERARIHEAIAHGVSDLLVKPYTTQRLGDKVIKALQRAGRQAAAELELAAARAAAEAAALAAAAPAPGGQQAAEPPAPPRLTILAVDDTPDSLRVISRVLEDRYRVRLAHNGEKALAICCSDDPPDLILLDVMMPGLDGFEVARRLRDHPNGEEMPVIFVTGMDDVVSQRRGLSLGAVDFITKPIDPDMLQLRINNFMRVIVRHKQRQEEYDDMLANARLREDVDRMLRHDLRGPLAGVAGLAQQLAASTDLAPRHAELVGLIQHSSEHALASIQLAGELFKIETGRYQRRTAPVALDAILAEVAALARATFASKRLAVDVSLAEGAVATACGDAVLYHAVFHNLVKNACEAAPDGSQVRIELAGQQAPAVTIANRGAVPAAMLGRLFTKYATTKPGGTGLGTYSAKLLVEAQGGALTIYSNPDTDHTVVTARLPAAGAA